MPACQRARRFPNVDDDTERTTMISPTTRIAAALTTAALAALALTGCAIVPSGPRVTTHVPITDEVHALLLETSADVTVELGDEASLELSGPQAALDRLEISERDGTLVIGADGPGSLFAKVRATLVVTSFDELEIDGSGDVVADFSSAESVSISIDGSGEVVGRGVDAQAVDVRISGSGDVTLTGAAEHATYVIEGSGEIDADGLVAVDASAAISGAGDIEVHATGAVDATIEGSGDIEIRGGAVVSSRISGSGDVTER